MPSSINAASSARDNAHWTWLRDYMRQHFRSGILQNATWMLSGRGLQLAGRIAYFIIVAHVLGPAGYGTFVACTALVATMSPFASFGTSHVMIKYAARKESLLPAYFANAFLVTIVFGSLLTLFALLIRPRVLPASSTAAMLTAVAIADLLGTQTTNTCLQAFQALDQGRRYAQLLALSTGMRLIAALVLAASARTPICWAYLYAASSAITMTAGLVAVSCCCSRPRFQLSLLLPSVREGSQFAITMASESVYDDIDKTMLARLGGVEAAAIYAVAYRFIDAATLPINSVAAATYPEFFRKGMHGVTSAFRFARRLLRRSVFYGVAITIALFLAAGLVPLVMGRAYAESAAALRWLCALPLIKSMRPFLTDTLTGANHQWQRAFLDIAVAVFNVLVNLWIIRVYAWRGAAWSSLMTESLFVILLYIIIRWHLGRERTSAGVATPQPVFAAGAE